MTHLIIRMLHLVRYNAPYSLNVSVITIKMSCLRFSDELVSRLLLFCNIELRDLPDPPLSTGDCTMSELVQTEGHSSNNNSTTTVPIDSASMGDDFVLVDIESLILGRPIKFPVYDQSGILLLAKDSIITPNFRRILRQRKITNVRLHSDDAEIISTTRVMGKLSEATRKANHNQGTTRRFRDAVGSGLQFVSNQGDAAQDAVIDHGSNGYCQEKQAELSEKNQKQGEALAKLMTTASGSTKLDGEIFREATFGFLEGMCEDFDCMNALSLNLNIDDKLAEHCQRMSILGMSLAVEMGLNDENVCRVGVTGLLHDWGMLKVPEPIRNPIKPLGKLERLELQKHVMYSVNILEKMTGLPTLVPLVSYQVHEQMNGEGYPRRRVGNNIHLFARILHVAHCYVELTTKTAYRQAFSPYDATIQLFRYTKNGILDPVVLRALLRAQSLFPVGSLVMLSSGSLAKVIRANGDQFAEPIVQIVQDKRGKQVEQSEKAILNLAETDCKVTQAMPFFHDAEPIPAPHFLKTRRPTKKRQANVHSR